MKREGKVDSSPLEKKRCFRAPRDGSTQQILLVHNYHHHPYNQEPSNPPIKPHLDLQPELYTKTARTLSRGAVTSVPS